MIFLLAVNFQDTALNRNCTNKCSNSVSQFDCCEKRSVTRLPYLVILLSSSTLVSVFLQPDLPHTHWGATSWWGIWLWEVSMGSHVGISSMPKIRNKSRQHKNLWNIWESQRICNKFMYRLFTSRQKMTVLSGHYES